MTKRKTKSKIERRGRKPGDGILKKIDASASALEKAVMMAHGHTANNFFGDAVRFARTLPSMIQDLKERRRRIGEERVLAAKYPIIPDGAPDSALEGMDSEAVRYWRDARRTEKWINDTREQLVPEMLEALLYSDAGWFKEMAAAIEVEAEADGQDQYPLHNTLLKLHGAPKIHRATILKPGGILNGGVPMDTTPRFTIGQLCEHRELQRFRQQAQNHGDEDWKRTIRRACEQLGLPLLQSQPGRKAKIS
jgi:hypothetical protein